MPFLACRIIVLERTITAAFGGCHTMSRGMKSHEPEVAPCTDPHLQKRYGRSSKQAGLVGNRTGGSRPRLDFAC